MSATEDEPIQKFSVWSKAQERFNTSKLTGDFWTLYVCSLLIDFALCLHFFMFSLYLIERHFSVKDIGFITASLMIGTIAGTVATGLLSRRWSLRSMMLTYIFTIPICLGMRVFFLERPAQLGLAFLTGIIMSIWSVCCSPTIASLTRQENRAFAFSLFVATGIGTGAISGLFGGFLPGVYLRHVAGVTHANGVRFVLLLAVVVLILAIFPMLRLRLQSGHVEQTGNPILSGFFMRFMIAIAVWNFAMGFFTPFMNIYLSKYLGLPLTKVGTIFSLAQVVQFAAVLLAPFLYRKFSVVIGIVLAQVGTAVMLAGLSRATALSGAIPLFMLFSAFQWMSGPGIVSLLMNNTPEQHRSSASAIQNIVNLGAQSAAAAIAGRCFERFGYSGPLMGNAGVAILAGLLLYTLIQRTDVSFASGEAV